MKSFRLSPIALTRALATALVVLATGCPEPQTPPTLPAPSTIVSFTATATTVAKGESVVVSWEVKDAESVTLTRENGSSLPGFESKLKGTLEVKVQESMLLLLSAHGPGGSDSATLQIKVEGSAEELLLALLPTKISAGEASTLLWSAPAGLAVTIRDQAGQVLVDGVAESSGSRLVQPRFTTTYELETSVGKVQSTLQVAPTIFSFAPDKPAADPGEAVSLTWSAGGGDRVVVRRGLVVLTDTRDLDAITSGRVEDPAPPAVVEDGVVTYTMELYSGEGVTTRIREVYVGSAPRFGEINVAELIRYDRPYTLSWQAFKTDRVEISVDGDVYYVSPTAADAAEGTLTLNPPTRRVTLTLRAWNDRGGEDVEVREVEPVRPPLLQAFTASTHLIANGGEPVVLTWDIPHAKRTVIRDDRERVIAAFEGAAATGGQITHFPNRKTTYTLNADNKLVVDGALQSVTETLEPVVVTTPATLIFDRERIGVGGQVSIIGATVPGARAIVQNAFQFMDIRETGTALVAESTDDGTSKIALETPFHLPMYGATVSANVICVTTNGWLVFQFDPTAPCVEKHSNTNGLSELPPYSIAPYFDDLGVKSADDAFRYFIDTFEGRRRLTIQWTNAHKLGQTSTGNLTFQVQLIENTGVVFLYDTMIVTGPDASIGVRDGSPTGVGFEHSSSVIEAPFTLLGEFDIGTVELPFPVKIAAKVEPSTYRVAFNGGVIEVSGSPEIIPPHALVVTEVLSFSSVPGGEYIEVLNRTSEAFDLSRIQLELPNGTIVQAGPAGSTLAGGGLLVFGQTVDGGGRGVPVNVVYGTAPEFELLDAKGIIKVRLDEGTNSQAEYNQFFTNYTAAGVPDVALRFDSSSPTRMAASNFNHARSCPETEVFGGGPLKGTPGAPTRACFPYRAERLAEGDFVSIASTGFQITLTASGSWVEADEGHAMLPPVGMVDWVPINIEGEFFPELAVFSNGFLSRQRYPVPAADGGTPTKPNHFTNRTSPSPGGTDVLQTIAPFWDDLRLPPPADGGIFVQRNTDDIDPSLSHTVVSWEHVSTTSTPAEYDLNFQVKFFDSGDIEFHYGDMLNIKGSTGVRHQGSEATVWLEERLGYVAEAIRINTAFGQKIEPNSGYRFHVRPYTE